MSEKNEDDMNKEEQQASADTGGTDQDTDKQEHIQEKLKTMGVMPGGHHEHSDPDAEPRRRGLLVFLLLLVTAGVLILYYFNREPVNNWFVERFASDQPITTMHTEPSESRTEAAAMHMDPQPSQVAFDQAREQWLDQQQAAFQQRQQAIEERKQAMEKRRTELETLRAEINAKLDEYQDKLFADAASGDYPLYQPTPPEPPQWVRQRQQQMHDAMNRHLPPWFDRPVGSYSAPAQLRPETDMPVSGNGQRVPAVNNDMSPRMELPANRQIGAVQRPNTYGAPNGFQAPPGPPPGYFNGPPPGHPYAPPYGGYYGY